MGVHNLWSLLTVLCEEKPLTYLSGKTVAVDLSGWVVQAAQCPALSKMKNPHIRNLFFRVSRLLQLDIFPIFVLEGMPPSLKEDAIKERNVHHKFKYISAAITRTKFNRILNECQDLLSSLGVPCVKGSGEAEAFCAFLYMNGIVDGVITEDNDVFLYGANVVYRDFTINDHDPHVKVYDLQSQRNKLHLTREKLVALALLLGCDYSDGVPGIGKETAFKLLSELDNVDILKRFSEWKLLREWQLFPGLKEVVPKKPNHCRHCGHLGSLMLHNRKGCTVCCSDSSCNSVDKVKACQCEWHTHNTVAAENKTELKVISYVKKCPTFPQTEVINEYLNYTDKIPDMELLQWKPPSLSEFQKKAYQYLGWTFDNSSKKFLPIITSWQQYRLKMGFTNMPYFVYEPVRIVKERCRKDVDYFEVEWKINAEKEVNEEVPRENMTTLEYSKRFCKSYKDFVDGYYNSQQKLREDRLAEKRKTKMKSKKLKTSDCTKIHDFFPVVRHAGHERTLKQNIHVADVKMISLKNDNA